MTPEEVQAVADAYTAAVSAGFLLGVQFLGPVWAARLLLGFIARGGPS